MEVLTYMMVTIMMEANTIDLVKMIEGDVNEFVNDVQGDVEEYNAG